MIEVEVEPEAYGMNDLKKKFCIRKKLKWRRKNIV